MSRSPPLHSLPAASCAHVYRRGPAYAGAPLLGGMLGVGGGQDLSDDCRRAVGYRAVDGESHLRFTLIHCMHLLSGAADSQSVARHPKHVVCETLLELGLRTRFCVVASFECVTQSY